MTVTPTTQIKHEAPVSPPTSNQQNSGRLTPTQISIVRSTVPILKEHGFVITNTFYSNLLHDVPSLNNIFNTSSQKNGAQPLALAGALFAYASHIDDLGALSPEVEKICQRHASLYVKEEHYAVVGKYLIAAMHQVLGDGMTQEVEDAWVAAYTQLADIMIGREKVLYAEQATDGWPKSAAPAQETDGWRDFVVDRKVQESEDVTSFYLVPKTPLSLPTYHPGQYISIRIQLPNSEYKQARQYSLSDAPGKPYYRISVKRDRGITRGAALARAGLKNIDAKPGVVSNLLHDNVQQGDVVELSHPAGEFYLANDNESPLVLISAGIGLTPMLSMLNSVTSKPTDDDRQISWIHATTGPRPFGPHIDAVMAQNPKHRRQTVFVKQSNNVNDEERNAATTYQHGRFVFSALDLERDLFLSNPQTRYFVCGPAGFMTDIKKGLTEELGVDDKRVQIELFGTGAVAVYSG